jgi:hypothetical protein
MVFVLNQSELLPVFVKLWFVFASGLVLIGQMMLGDS